MVRVFVKAIFHVGLGPNLLKNIRPSLLKIITDQEFWLNLPSLPSSLPSTPITLLPLRCYPAHPRCFPPDQKQPSIGVLKLRLHFFGKTEIAFPIHQIAPIFRELGLFRSPETHSRLRFLPSSIAYRASAVPLCDSVGVWVAGHWRLSTHRNQRKGRNTIPSSITKNI